QSFPRTANGLERAPRAVFLVRQLQYVRQFPREVISVRRKDMGVHSRELRASFHVKSCAGPAGYVPHPDLPSIDLAIGSLLVGKTPIKNARFSRKQISWTQQSPQKFTSGLLFLEHGPRGAELHGRIYQGATAKDAVAHDVVGTLVKPAEYSLMLTRSEFDVGVDPE
ncbi:hypothetical protein VaNZ11_003110, partial [Volvox africanus]